MSDILLFSRKILPYDLATDVQWNFVSLLITSYYLFMYSTIRVIRIPRGGDGIDCHPKTACSHSIRPGRNKFMHKAKKDRLSPLR